MKALVLAGGGSKGAYEIGVWKALKKLNINFDIVTGTSIGALNGAFIVQGNYLKCKRLWLTTNFYELFGPELKNMSSTKKMLKMYGKNILNKTGIDTKEYEKKVKKCINIDKFYKSNIDYGIVTYNFSARKPFFATKKNIKKEKLCDYIIASTSCFPALDMKEIDGDKYIDGGYYDVLPINLAIEMGADSVIAVDLESIGIRRKVKNKNIDITYITPSCNLGNFLVFNKDLIKRNMSIGYNDTMKTFKKLDGKKYTFKNHDLNKNYKKYGKDFKYIIKRMIGINSPKTLTQLSKISTYKNLIKYYFNDDKIMFNAMNNTIESLGEMFEIPNYPIYDINMFNNILKIKFSNYESPIDINITNLKTLTFNKTINHKDIIKIIYKLMEEPVEYYKELTNLSILYPKEFIGTLYLYTMI